MNKKITIGCGLIGIGREWGHKQSMIPTDQSVYEFLQAAYDAGIRYFDTAPSYGSSEERLGDFLRTLSSDQLKQTFITTKFGEHWNSSKHEPYTDHSYEALKNSIDLSLRRLSKIDLLYVHKTTPKVLKSDDLHQAIHYAKSKNIQLFGASVSDNTSASIAIGSNHLSYIQLPYNPSNQTFDSIIDKASKMKKYIVVNRPFNMGKHLYNVPDTDPMQQKVDAFAFIMQKKFEGVILTGTKDIHHLQENLKAFKLAQNEY